MSRSKGMTKPQVVEFIQEALKTNEKAIDGFKRLNDEGIDCRDLLSSHRGRSDAMIDILLKINK